MNITLPAEDRFQWWNARLAGTYFNQPGKPCVLAVDESELERLAPGQQDAVADLAQAVRHMAGSPTSNDYFPGITALFQHWQARGKNGLPPVLPLLAVSVLAATRMHRDGAYSKTNYYVRLSEILATDRTPGTVEKIRDEVRTKFRPVATMWQALDDYLRSHPEHGESTIRDHPSYTIIGYPLSQALIRRSDRATLTQFFAKMDLSAHSTLPADALLAYLRLWASRPRGFSEAFLVAINDDDLEPMILPLILGLVHSWDGRVLEPEGRKQSTVRMSIDLDEWCSSWVVEAADQPDEVVNGTVCGQPIEVRIARREGETYAKLEGLPASHGLLCRSGFELKSQEAVLVARGARLLFFTEDPALGAWLSRDSMAPYEEHVVAASRETASAFRAALEAAADPGWQELRQNPASPLLAGYVIYRGVRFSRGAQLDAALQKMPSLAVYGLRPDQSVRARFINGLPVARAVSSDRYLKGGAPDLLLPSGPESRWVTVTLDGVPQQFKATGFPVPLRRVPGLEVGRHTIVVEGETLTFHLVDDDPGPEPAAGAGSVGWTVSGDLAAVTAGSLSCGAVVKGVDRLRPVLAQRGLDETVVIHSDGHWQTVAEPGHPVFLALVVDPSPRFEVWVSESATWLAQRRGARWRVRALADHPPSFSPSSLSTADRDNWRRLVGNGPEDDASWCDYLDAAGVDE